MPIGKGILKHIKAPHPLFLPHNYNSQKKPVSKILSIESDRLVV